jgi:hypothetical protein
MISVFHPDFQYLKFQINDIITSFDNQGSLVGDGKRNVIKIFEVKGIEINVKSFKTPNLINKIVYRFFRKSKAQRSFEYALRLEKMGIGTPKPVAYFEFPRGLFFDRSFYVSVQMKVDFTFKEFLLIENHTSQDIIIAAVTAFTYQLHELGIHFLDHTSGNTLIKEIQGQYHCFLVDLNRMNFNQKLNYEKRINNLCKLTNNPVVLNKIATVYAGFMNENIEQTQSMLINYSNAFFNKFNQKKKIKKKLFFWKK